MESINLGRMIAQLRKSAGLTQADLADHLGVTKAAVSKWELGQSLPDMAQLPRIASYFSVTIDELFAYRPQMSERDIKRLAAEISRFLPDDTETAIAECRRFIKDYYSCWPLVIKLSHLMYTAAIHANPSKPDPSIIEEASGYYEHVAECADDVEMVRAARFVGAGMALTQGRYEEAVERFEGLKTAQPLEVEPSLAAAYRMLGDTEKAIEINQEHLYWSVSGVINSCAALIPLCGHDGERLHALVTATEGVIKLFGLSDANPSYELSAHFAAASAYKQMGHLDRAYEQLEQFARDAGRADELFSLDRDPGMLFDRLGHLFRPEADDDDRVYLENAMAGFGRLGLIQMLETDPAWADARDDPRFAAIVSSIESS